MGCGLIAPMTARAINIDVTPLSFPRGQTTQGGWAQGQAPAGWSVTLDGALIPTDAQGRFFVGFDRDAAKGATLIGTAPDGTQAQAALTITPRAWRIEQVNAPFRPPALPDAEFTRIRSAELARITAARALASASDGWRQDFVWPAKGRISGLFGAQRVYQGAPGSYHGGTDVALPTGTPYVAPADGVVVLAVADTPFTQEGHLLMVDHGMGLVSAFLHSSALLVREGDRVTQGQPIGKVGMTGRASGPHLHWGLRWREARLDPLLIAPALSAG
ncbi:peptidoglycan DD-metalloendopeptidase family protein [Novosphingobium sp. FSY-8]|uniref:Peptidoglycan DD-metalloendopeptidase family protein n=2 Tax=Novosphingobium ovatum TaxID=1908523 RepID=A0ABW9XEP1_9SPHN|nr:peptidoglycan DD-metalloendopeptidase family protein [Novosphingobium ovatum]